MIDQITEHARCRTVQRFVRRRDLDLLLEEGDLLACRQRGAQSLRLSRDALRDAESRGVEPDMLKRAAALTAVIADGRVLTVYRHNTSRRSVRRSRLR